MSYFFYPTVALYSLTSLLFLAILWRRDERLLRLGRWSMVLLVLVHLGAVGGFCLHGQHPLSGASGALNFTAFLLMMFYLASLFRWRLYVAGAALVPMALALVLSGRFTPFSEQQDPGELTRALSELHLSLVSIGVVLFALAAALGVLYILQENALKSGKPGALYQRTPPLNTLDDLGRSLILVAFPIYTVAVIAGVLWGMRLPGGASFRVEYLISTVIWLIFGGLIAARFTVGLRGRKAALLTVLGFAATVAVILIYVFRRMAGT